MSEKKIDEKEWLKAELEVCMEKYVESTKEIESLQAKIERYEKALSEAKAHLPRNKLLCHCEHGKQGRTCLACLIKQALSDKEGKKV